MLPITALEPQGSKDGSAESHTGPRTPDEALVACVLVTVWSVRTGRTLRPVPTAQLAPDELLAFWDDFLPDPPGTTGERAT